MTRSSSSAQGPLLPEHQDHIDRLHESTPAYLPYIPFRPRAVNVVLTTSHPVAAPQSMHPVPQSILPAPQFPPLTVAVQSQTPAGRSDVPHVASGADCRSRRALNRMVEVSSRRGSSRSRSPNMSGRASTSHSGQCQSTRPMMLHANVSLQVPDVSRC
jgi:hypothetical protein